MHVGKQRKKLCHKCLPSDVYIMTWSCTRVLLLAVGTRLKLIIKNSQTKSDPNVQCCFVRTLDGWWASLVTKQPVLASAWDSDADVGCKWTTLMLLDPFWTHTHMELDTLLGEVFRFGHVWKSSGLTICWFATFSHLGIIMLIVSTLVFTINSSELRIQK